MLREEDIAIELRCQQFLCKCYMRDLNEERSVLWFKSEQKTETVSCPYCQGRVYSDGYGQITFPNFPWRTKRKGLLQKVRNSPFHMPKKVKQRQKQRKERGDKAFGEHETETVKVVCEKRNKLCIP